MMETERISRRTIADVPDQPPGVKAVSRRDFVATSGLALLGLAAHGGGDGPVEAAEPIIDIHQHVGYSGRPESTVITQTVLWIATVLVLLALTIGWWAPFLY